MRFWKYLITAGTLFMMVLIFWFSSKPAEESTEMSNRVGYTLSQIFVSGFSKMTEEEQLIQVESMDHGIRKCAHAAEYLLLTLLCIGTCICWLKDKQLFQGNSYVLLFVSGWLIAVLYAVSDEIHQMFVPGRSCQFTDIIIDACGGLIGALLLFLILSRIRRKTKTHAA